MTEKGIADGMAEREVSARAWVCGYMKRERSRTGPRVLRVQIVQIPGIK